MAKRATNGAGCFRPYKKDMFEYRVQYGTKSNGKPRIVNVTGKTKKECKDKMKEKLEKLDGPVCIEDCSKITLTELCYKHFNADLTETEKLKDTGADRREVTIKNQVAKYDIGKLQVMAITPQDVYQHIEYLIANTKLKVSSIQKAFYVINSAYNWAISQQMISVNPCTPVKEKITYRFKNLKDKHSTDSDIIVLSDEEIALFRAEATKLNKNSKPLYQYGLGALFILEVAIRSGEYSALRLDRYNETTHTLAVTMTRKRVRDRNAGEGEKKTKIVEGIVKNYHAREIVLSEEAERLLKAIIKNTKATNPNDYIQINSRGGPTEPTRLWNDFNIIYRKIGLDKGITGAHVLRRTFATKAYEAGASTLAIAAYLGDTEQTVTHYYISTRKRIRIGNKTINIIPLPNEAPKRGLREIKSTPIDVTKEPWYNDQYEVIDDEDD